MPVPRVRLTLALIVAVSATVFPITGSAQADEPPTSSPPFDYIAQGPKLSQPIYPDTVIETTTLPAADGEEIYLAITRPDPAVYGDLELPVILEASPYHGTLHIRTGTRIFPDPIDEYGRQVGISGYFAPRGYAVAMMDLRGTGRSTGCLDHLGANDGADMKMVIEWLADQDWSNGRVGMTGHSYVGSTPTVAAAQNPDGLATIVPSAGLASMYDHQFQMGVPYNLQWVGPMAAYEMLGIDRDLPPQSFTTDPVGGGRTGDNWDNAPSADMGCGMQNSSVIAGSGQVTGQYEGWHAQRDWSDEAAAADIPTFMVHGVNDNAARIPAAEWFFEGRVANPEDKVWLGQWDHGSTNGSCGNPSNGRVLHPNCRFDQWVYALHAWFDHHLAQRTWTDQDGVEHEIETGPPVEVFLNDQASHPVTQILDPEQLPSKVYTADAWAPGSSPVELYPDATGDALRFGPPAAPGSKVLASGVHAVAASVSAASLTFRSDPVAEDMVLLGIPELELHASVSTGEIVHLVAQLGREDATGTREVINTCAIQPQLRERIDTITPVVPMEEMSLPMQCFTMAHWVPAGHRLVLTVGLSSPHHATFGADRQITVFTGAEDTKYVLPMVPAATLHPDVKLREPAGPPATFPEGVAQPGTSETVTVVPPFVHAAPFAAPVEFDILKGYDNASLSAVATSRGDVDLYLQQQLGDEWVMIQAAESSSNAGETLTAGRQPPGHYRILVVNFLATPEEVPVTITFKNQQGQVGGAGGTTEESASVPLGRMSRTTGALPLL